MSLCVFSYEARHNIIRERACSCSCFANVNHSILMNKNIILRPIIIDGPPECSRCDLFYGELHLYLIHYTGDAENLDPGSTRRLNFIHWRLIFLGPQYVTCFRSPNLAAACSFFGGEGRICAPLHSVFLSQARYTKYCNDNK
jgi:hypothetical protein